MEWIKDVVAYINAHEGVMVTVAAVISAIAAVAMAAATYSMVRFSRNFSSWTQRLEESKYYPEPSMLSSYTDTDNHSLVIEMENPAAIPINIYAIDVEGDADGYLWGPESNNEEELHGPMQIKGYQTRLFRVPITGKITLGHTRMEATVYYTSGGRCAEKQFPILV